MYFEQKLKSNSNFRFINSFLDRFIKAELKIKQFVSTL